MNCLDETTILQFANGELAGPAVARVEQHLGSCDECMAVCAVAMRTRPPRKSEALAARDPGTPFGRYRIESLLGTGGMGQVYRAHDTVLRRSVALKLLHSDGDAEDSLSASRLMREARAAAALSHPNAVSVFDVGEIEGIAFIAMELVEGRTLRSTIGDPTVSTERKLRWLLQVAQALEAAHASGLVHRDIKPDNIRVCSNDSIKVLDFGMAKRVEGAGAQGVDALSPGPSREGPESFKTKVGVVSGTPKYMAPEQALGAPCDARSDQFSWALVACELLLGALPDRKDSFGPPGELPGRVRLLGALVPDAPAGLGDLLTVALALKPERRHHSMGEIAARLEKLALEPPSRAPPVGPDTASVDGVEGGVTLSDAVSSQAVAALVARPPEPRPRPPRTHAWIALAAALGTVAVTAALVRAFGDPRPATPLASEVAVATCEPGDTKTPTTATGATGAVASDALAPVAAATPSTTPARAPAPPASAGHRHVRSGRPHTAPSDDSLIGY